MRDYLVFLLYGPMASWGEIAVGESRHSAAYPSKSALLGLLAAALGIRRDEEDAQAILAAGYRFAVKLLAAGTPLRDYHTVQWSSPQKKAVCRTRRQELADSSQVKTSPLSDREYRCDGLVVVAVEALADAPYRLATLAGALEKPCFPLYLGRKSCPLAAPLQVQLLAADSARAALDTANLRSLSSLQRHDEPIPLGSGDESRHFRLRKDAIRYYWEDGMESGMDKTMSLIRHDQPTSRRRWQFAPRREHVHLTEWEGA